MLRSLLYLGLALVLTKSTVCPAQSPAVQQLYQKAHADQEAGKQEAAVADYRELLRLDSSIAPAYNNLGRLLYNMGRFSEAATTLRQGLVIDPTMAPANVMLGAAYLQLGQATEALAPLQAGVQALPADRFARITLARVLLGLNRPDDAVIHLNAMIAGNPKDQEAWYLLGKVHLQLSQQAFTQVQSIDMHTPLANELAGEIMESMQNTPGAVAAYKEAIQAANSEDNTPLQHLANLYWSTGDWENARQQYISLLAREPGNCIAHWRLANSLDELGEAPASGLKEVNLALDQCPSLVQARAERARLLIRSGQPKQALPDLEAAQRQAPDEPSVQQLLAQAYRALGDRARADAANQAYLQLEQKLHSAKEAHAKTVIQANQ